MVHNSMYHILISVTIAEKKRAAVDLLFNICFPPSCHSTANASLSRGGRSSAAAPPPARTFWLASRISIVRSHILILVALIIGTSYDTASSRNCLLASHSKIIIRPLHRFRASRPSVLLLLLLTSIIIIIIISSINIAHYYYF